MQFTIIKYSQLTVKKEQCRQGNRKKLTNFRKLQNLSFKENICAVKILLISRTIFDWCFFDKNFENQI